MIGIPKTIDNDISLVQQSFGFDTAVSEARRATYAANVEAKGASNGIGLVKLMGRHSGFIAAYSALANNHVNFCLVPEVPFTLEGFLRALQAAARAPEPCGRRRAEGAGQDLMARTGSATPPATSVWPTSGRSSATPSTILHGARHEITVKYIDPSYTIRSAPANARDSAFCLLLGHHAVHAGSPVEPHGGRLLEPRVHARPDRRRRGAEADRPGGRALEQRDQSTGQPLQYCDSRSDCPSSAMDQRAAAGSVTSTRLAHHRRQAPLRTTGHVTHQDLGAARRAAIGQLDGNTQRDRAIRVDWQRRLQLFDAVELDWTIGDGGASCSRPGARASSIWVGPPSPLTPSSGTSLP